MRCFLRSSVASLAAAGAIAATWYVLHPVGFLSGWLQFEMIAGGWGAIAITVVLCNIVPDYLSLFETRTALRLARRGWGLPSVLALDFVLTLVIAVLSVRAAVPVAMLLQDSGMKLWTFDRVWRTLTTPVFVGSDFTISDIGIWDVTMGPWRIFLLSAFFTSAWLWLYAGSVVASRALLRATSGFGAILRVTDVQDRPFRVLGFVAVVIVSVFFCLGLAGCAWLIPSAPVRLAPIPFAHPLVVRGSNPEP